MRRPIPPGWIALALVLCLGGGAAIAQPNGLRAPAAPLPVYVADFELGVENAGTGKAAAPEEPAGRARELIDLMASSLVRDFTMVGLKARRLAPDEPLPSTGWLIRGVFVSVDAANRFSRLAIGWGTGVAGLKLQVVATLDDLAHGVPRPVYEIDRSRSEANVAALKFNPYAIAVRFALTDSAVARSVGRTAGEISREVIQRARQ